MKVMKRFLFVVSLLAALIFCGKPVLGQEGEKSGKDAVMSFLAKYKDVEGFNEQTFVKGEGLGLIKAQMGKKMGKSFMKGVTVLTMVDYTEVKPQVCDSIHADYNLYFSKFTEVEIPDSTMTEEKYARTFFQVKEDEKAVSDFITVIEDKEMKILLYMGGVIKVEDFKVVAEVE
jgi:hypothetical protein